MKLQKDFQSLSDVYKQFQSDKQTMINELNKEYSIRKEQENNQNKLCNLLNDRQNKLQNLSQDYLCMKNMNDKEILIVLMQKNKKENIYENKKIFFIQNDPNIFGTKELYDLCRIHSNWMNISIAKYNKGNYDYEEIKEYDDNNKSISLKKGNYTLRDSDWIAIKNLDEDDVFMTKFDIEQRDIIKKIKEENKKMKLKEKSSKKSYEKPLRIKLDD